MPPPSQRPDPTSPKAIKTASFATNRRGFDPAEVSGFLIAVAAEVESLQARVAALAEELEIARQTPTVAIDDLDEDAVRRVLGEEATRILADARVAADEIEARAEETAARLLSEANDDAQKLRADAEVEAGRRRQDATLISDEEIKAAKQEGREMVEEARAYRERVLSELARRRELARKQIESLMQGRDRLVEAFERSRLIAIDVIADMTPLGTINEEFPAPPPATTGQAPVTHRAVPAAEPAAVPVVEAETVVEPVVELVVEPVVESEVEAPTPNPQVDDLFARLRAATTEVVVEKADKKRKGKRSAKQVAKEAKATPADQPKAAAKASVFQPSPSEPATSASSEDSPFGRRDAALSPLIATSLRNLKRVLADEQNDVLDVLRGRAAVTSVDSILPEADAHVRRYAEAIDGELRQAAIAGAASVNDGLDGANESVSDVDALQPAIDSLTLSVITPLRERLERAVAAADGDNDEIVGLTRTIYREWKTRRLDEHLDDVVRMAFGRGALSALKAGTPVLWAVDPNGPACPDAEDNALAGVIAAGDSFPTEHTCAPAHDGCRCMLLVAAR